jgi:hypothetical protein
MIRTLDGNTNSTTKANHSRSNSLGLSRLKRFQQQFPPNCTGHWDIS